MTKKYKHPNTMLRNKAAKGMWALFSVIVAAFLAVGAIFVGYQKFSPAPLSISSDKADSMSLVGCPTDGGTTLTFSVKNLLNSTGDETFDTAYRFIDSDGEAISGTDSTAGSVTLNCGETYTITGISAAGADGDSAKYKSIVSGSGELNSDGTVTFKAKKDTQSLIVGGAQHGVLEFRAKDIVNDGYMFDNVDGTATDYETDGIQFNSTTSSSSTAVGVGGEFHVQLEYRPTVSDNAWGDRGGHYLLVDAASNVYNTPTVKVNGKTLTDVKDQLNPDEKKAYTGYEYVYLVTDEITQANQGIVDFSIFAISGVNPGASDDIQIDVASRGAYASSSNGNLVKVGSVQDDSAQTVVHTLMDTAFDIS